MKFMSWRLIVTEIDELTRVQVQRVRPILISTAGIENNERPVLAASGCTKPALVPNPLQKLRNRVVSGIAAGATLIHCVDD